MNATRTITGELADLLTALRTNRDNLRGTPRADSATSRRPCAPPSARSPWAG
ncbi:MAG: hypothetical protein ACT4O0_10940 [Pseudonocardia sp.]